MKSNSTPIKDREGVAREVLEPYLEGIYECIVGGIKDFSDNHGALIRTFRKTTRANLIHDYITERIRVMWATHPEIRIRESKVFVVIFGDKCYVKFKKLNNKLRTANIETNQVRDFRNQLFRDSEAKGIVFNLEAGYQLDITETEAKAVYVVCPVEDGRRNEFRIQLDNHSTQGELFIGAEKKQREHRRVKVKAKINQDGISKESAS